MSESPPYTDALESLRDDYIAILSFQNYYLAVGVYLTKHGDAWTEFLQTQEQPLDSHPHYCAGYHDDYLAQYMVRAAAEMFTNYLVDLLKVLLVARPEILRSSAQVKVEEVLRHSSMGDFVDWYAERKVNELSYGSLMDLEDFFSGRLGLSICEDADDFARTRRLIANRNLLVHARGVINDTYRKAADLPEAVVGDTLNLDVSASLDEPMRIYQLARSLDARAASKFGP